MTLGAAHAGGCNTASFGERVPCRGSGCACEEDPQQPLCKGFDQRGDASLTEPFDGAPQDASEAAVDSSDATDADSDAGGDAR
jgi:hypothetical protein